MKKTIFKIGILLLVGIIVSFYTYSCQTSEDKGIQKQPNYTPSRIIIKERTGTAWGSINQYEIVEVDGIEYLTSSHGGLIALPKR